MLIALWTIVDKRVKGAADRRKMGRMALLASAASFYKYSGQARDEAVMPKPLLIVSLLLVILAVGCSEDGEVLGTTAPASVSPAATASITPSVTPTAPSSTTTTEVQSPTPSPTVPLDWNTYTDPNGLFTVSYPTNWFKTAGQAQFSSYDLSTVTGPGRPREAIGVEVSYYEASGSNTCAGTISTDPKSGEELGIAPWRNGDHLGGLAGVGTHKNSG